MNSTKCILIVVLVSTVAWGTTIKITSNYPEEAIRKCIEGWVIVEYSVLRDGTTINHKVVDSVPKGVFEESALESARKLNYAGNTELTGKRINGVQFKYSFSLDRDSPAHAHCK